MNDTSRCPMCNKRMVTRDGVPTCPDCGYRASMGGSVYYGISDRDTASAAPAASDAASATTTGSDVSATPAGSDATPVSGSTLRQEQQKIKKTAVTVAVSCVLVITIAIVGIIFGKKFIDNGSGQKQTTGKHAENQTNKPAKPDISQGGTGTNSSKNGYRPESDMMIELAEIIFGKGINSITREELDSITYLDIYKTANGSRAIYFELADGNSATCFMKSTSLSTNDIRCFGGLQCLLLEDDTLDYNTDWSSLKNLCVLKVKSNAEALAKVMDVSQLYALVLGADALGGRSLKSLSAYKNLEYLELDAYYLNSIEGISTAPRLTQLYIRNGNSIEDFEELYDMTQLEVLSIEASKLRDIGFISSMDKLEEFAIKGTAVKKIDAISDCADTLTTLSLRDNYSLSLSDYDVVYSCTKLLTLELCVNYDFDVPMEAPDLSMMPNLMNLTLGNFDIFSNLNKTPWLVSLTLCDTYTGDSEALIGLDELSFLRLDNMSIEPSFFEPLANMTNLVTLNLNDSFYWGDPAVFLKAPALENLYLENSTVGICEHTMPVCESLQILDLKKTRFCLLNEDGSWDYANMTYVALCDYPFFVKAFPNLFMLYAPGHGFDDISFTEGMNNLYYLDISDNYITDLTPLSALPSLRIVICNDNPIHNRTGLDNVILIE